MILLICNINLNLKVIKMETWSKCILHIFMHFSTLWSPAGNESRSFQMCIFFLVVFLSPLSPEYTFILLKTSANFKIE